MSSKSLVKALVASSTAAVIAVSGASVASAAPQAPGGAVNHSAVSNSAQVLDQKTAKQLWNKFNSAAKQQDAGAVKQAANQILNGLPQARSVAQTKEFNKARSLTAQLSDRTARDGSNPLCGLVTSLGGVLSNLLNSLVGAGLPIPDPGQLCSMAPGVPGAPDLPKPPVPGT